MYCFLSFQLRWEPVFSYDTPGIRQLSVIFSINFLQPLRQLPAQVLRLQKLRQLLEAQNPAEKLLPVREAPAEQQGAVRLPGEALRSILINDPPPGGGVEADNCLKGLRVDALDRGDGGGEGPEREGFLQDLQVQHPGELEQPPVPPFPAPAVKIPAGPPKHQPDGLHHPQAVAGGGAVRDPQLGVKISSINFSDKAVENFNFLLPVAVLVFGSRMNDNFVNQGI